jgi:hypothetical protein
MTTANATIGRDADVLDADVLEVAPVRGTRLAAKVHLGGLRTLADGESTPERHATWRILTVKDGDKRVVWDTGDFAEMADAKRLFNECLAAGLVPYVCDESGRPTGEVMDTFDPSAGEVVFKDVVFAPARLAVGG